MQPLINYLKQPASFVDSIVHNYFKWLPDSTYLKLRYRFQMQERLDLENPQSFQEKLQWLKLYNRIPEYPRMVDKILVKEYVSSIIGSEFVVPLLGVWDRPEDIEWGELPERFVLKTNHGGGNTGVVICRGKNTLDIDNTIARLNSSLKMDIYRDTREWPYKNVKKKVFAEELIELNQQVKDLPDYKWYCFNGEPKYCQVIQDRNTNETIDFFDTTWKHQEFIGLNPAAKHASIIPVRPKNLEKQVQIAKRLSKDIPFARIDLYEIEGHVYFGEITFFPMSGFGKFFPNKYNEIFGNILVLPEKHGAK